MIAKFNFGSGFAGLIDYANDLENKNTNIIASDGVSISGPKAMAASMHLQARSNPNVKQYVGHCMLSFSPKDTARMTDAFVEHIARDYMQRMGIVNTQFAIYRHHDQPHDHVHIVYNRVDNDGNEIKSDHNFKKSVGITKKMTREYGLTFGKGKKDVRRERLRGKDAAKYRFYDTISPLLGKVSSWEQFRAELAMLGFTMNIYHSADGKAKGIAFSDGKISLSGSWIDRALGYGAINRAIQDNARLNNYQYFDSTVRPIVATTKVAETFNQQENVASQIATSITDGAEQGVAVIEDAAGDVTSAAGSVGAALVEMVSIATEIQPSVGGGGGSSKLDDDDDEKYKRKNGYGRRKR